VLARSLFLPAPPQPCVVRCAGWVIREMLADPIVKVIRALDNEVVVVVVERNGEFVQEPVRAEHTLEWHLEVGIFHEGDMRLPSDFGLGGEGELHVLELDVPRASENSNRPVVRAGLPESDPDCVASTAIKEGNRCASVYKSTERPIASVAMLQANVQSGPENGRVALLPVWEEVIDPAQPTPITMSSVWRGTNCATAPAAAGPLLRTIATRSRLFSDAAMTSPSLMATHRPAQRSMPAGRRTGSTFLRACLPMLGE
jgi:hypothetical protein